MQQHVVPLALVLIALAVIVEAFVNPIHVEVLRQARFANFVETYGKTYSSPQERLRRYQIFSDNIAFIDSFNAAKNATFTVGMNQFADLTNAEFRQMMNGYRYDPNATRNYVTSFPKNPMVTCPSDGMYTCDWRQAGVVTPIKNQGQCGSCWAFSSVASTEGAHAMATKQLVSLSEQNLIDCSTKYGNQGCNGGLMDNAFKYIIANNGIDTEASYPYKAADGTCHYSTANKGATLSSFKDIARGSESALQNACSSVGPISVAIDASHQSFQFYSSGVYYEPQCSSTQLDHGVTVVGFGTDNSKAFWLVKNSWGTTWGMQGYILMSRDKNNNCGIATQASYPLAPAK